jgi:7-cyano-7-deazaguanine synthase in queuosine biosynthesis
MDKFGPVRVSGKQAWKLYPDCCGEFFGRKNEATKHGEECTINGDMQNTILSAEEAKILVARQPSNPFLLE